ncbi:MAG: hypothetical protein KA184_17015 [Candidatus Hydrogenedentes bacterium]|nr:hypothetical protein [Candidatus Hydrogenedentota bacterium]
MRRPSDVRPIITLALLALALLVPCVLFAAATPVSGPLLAAFAQAESACAPHRNAVYLYLRIAGIAWILVEWGAAVVLWRSWRLLRAAQRNRTS